MSTAITALHTAVLMLLYRLDAQSSQSADTSVKNTTEVFDPLATWMEHTDRLARRLSGITNGQSAVLVDSLCRQYMLDFDSEPLDTTLCRLGRILESLSRCQNEVLQLAGVGHHLEAVNVSLKEVRVLIGWIDDILCVAMVEKNDVIKMHGEKGFMFQGK